MKRVLLRSPDLDAFVAHWDKQKQDSAIVRKALGQAYREKGEHAKAIKQLELAAALQPNDAEIYQLLVASYDQLGDKAGGLRQLLQAVQFARATPTYISSWASVMQPRANPRKRNAPTPRSSKCRRPKRKATPS